MKLPQKLFIILLFLCGPAYAGTGSAEDGHLITFILAGMLAIIWGVPHLFRYSKKVWKYILLKIQKYFSFIESVKTKSMFIHHV
jgi:hypothetical protein